MYKYILFGCLFLILACTNSPNPMQGQSHPSTSTHSDSASHSENHQKSNRGVQNQNARPGHAHHQPGEMNKRFLSKDLDVGHWQKGFSDPERDVVRHKDAIIKALKLKGGETVADVGAGTGLFLDGLLKSVGPKGFVYAGDISPKFIQSLQEKIKTKSLKAKAVLGELKTTSLPPKSADLILVVDTYHHFDYPKEMLTDFKNVLKPNGRLVIVDFNKTPTARPWIQSHIRLSKEEYIKEIEASGFTFVKEAKEIPFKESFFMEFKL